MIAGGAGISVMASYLQKYHQRAQAAGSETGAEGGAVQTRNVTLVWVHRRESFLQEVASDDLQDAMLDTNATVSLHSTAHSASATQKDSSDENITKTYDIKEAEIPAQSRLNSR
jgi:hypothetical protein